MSKNYFSHWAFCHLKFIRSIRLIRIIRLIFRFRFFDCLFFPWFLFLRFLLRALFFHSFFLFGFCLFFSFFFFGNPPVSAMLAFGGWFFRCFRFSFYAFLLGSLANINSPAG